MLGSSRNLLYLYNMYRCNITKKIILCGGSQKDIVVTSPPPPPLRGYNEGVREDSASSGDLRVIRRVRTLEYYDYSNKI